MSVYRIIGSEIRRYGTSVTVSDGSESVERKGFIQPLRYRSRVSVGGVIRDLGKLLCEFACGGIVSQNLVGIILNGFGGIRGSFFGIFLGMTYTGEAYHIIIVFAKIICIIFALHIIILMYEFLIAGGLSRKNPLRLLVNMLPAYFTALGTSSSAATIPVTLRQTKKNDVSDEIANFCVPLCATIHLSGSMMKITCCALTVCLIGGLPHDLPLFLHFIMLLGVCMVAAPGVPGGAVMAALGPMAGVLGFTPDAQALIIALYIAMDSFGTACNVTGDGALAVIIDKLHKSDASLHPSASGLQKDA